MLALAPHLYPPPSAQRRPDQLNSVDYKLGQCAVIAHRLKVLYPVQCVGISLSWEPTKHITSEDVCTPPSE